MTRVTGQRPQRGGGPAASRYAVGDLAAFAARALRAVGCSGKEAAEVAACLVEADARGVVSHGLLRLPLYVEAVAAGGIVPDAPMRWIHEAPAAAVLDAGYGFGQTAMAKAVGRAAELAAAAGCTAVGVRRSTHFGIGAVWATRLAERGLIGVVVSNTGPAMAPYGARDALLGTNPIAAALPVAGAAPVVLDMATSAAAYGRIVAARGDGETIPQGWAIDADGLPTTDAEAALAGALQPFGGHKGSGLALVIEALAGALTGALLSFEITDIWRDRASRMGTGHLVVAFDPRHFGVGDDFAGRLRALADRIRRSPPAEGHDAVQLPGDLERERAALAAREGIEVTDVARGYLDNMAAQLGLGGLPSPIKETPAQDRSS